ncbi:hypothetical protein [Streptomyces sp. NBC_00328]|uniref:hypothetical protein n=1 Tax=Streptomyces sp. NBC_00328 TaxID=2903646 RepID=UPI002E2AA047|nr:hypothetical protein [Streptomyces sp. NBC_00328]
MFAPAIAHSMGLPDVRRGIGWVFGLTGLFAFALAPAAGFVVARVSNRRRACGRFLVMAAVSTLPILFLVVIGVLFPECPDGYHC